MRLAIVAITRGGAELARRLGAGMPEADTFLRARFREDDANRYFSEPLSDLLPRLFREYDGLICVMATGIVVRLLAPVLQHKAKDPAVVVVDEGGQFAISLLSGHLGGANQLAGKVAERLGGQAVITTATDVHKLPAWDEVARLAGLGIEPLEQIKIFNRHLLEATPVALVDPQQRIAPWFDTVPSVLHCATFLDAEASAAQAKVYVTHRTLQIGPCNDAEVLLLRPRDLVVGIGCNRGTAADEIEAAVKQVLRKTQLSWDSVFAVASIDDKRDEPGLGCFIARHSLASRYFSAEELNTTEVPSPPSVHALRAVGAKGVCEPAALRAAHPGQLLVRKQKIGNVTVAVAETHGNQPVARQG